MIYISNLAIRTNIYFWILNICMAIRSFKTYIYIYISPPPPPPHTHTHTHTHTPHPPPPPPTHPHTPPHVLISFTYGYIVWIFAVWILTQSNSFAISDNYFIRTLGPYCTITSSGTKCTIASIRNHCLNRWLSVSNRRLDNHIKSKIIKRNIYMLRICIDRYQHLYHYGAFDAKTRYL